MERQFIIFYDYKEVHTPVPAAEAASLIYRYLSRLPSRMPDLNLGKCTISQIKDGVLTPANLGTIIFALNHEGECELILDTQNCGYYGTAAAFTEERLLASEVYYREDDIASKHNVKKLECSIFGNMTPEMLIAWEKQMAEEIEGVNVDIIENLESCNPLRLLHHTECVLFQTHLKYHLNRLRMDNETLDSQAGFAPGTVDKLFDPIAPMRPGKRIVEAIARIIRIKPNELWTDLMPIYTESNATWKDIAAKVSTTDLGQN